MVTTRYAVKGMTCGHCVSAVTAEVGRIEKSIAKRQKARGE